MNENQSLREQQEAARREILALKEKTPTSRVLNLFSRWFPKSILEHGLFYWLLQIILFNAVYFLPGLLISLTLGEMGMWAGKISAWVVCLEMAIYGFIQAHSVSRSVFNDIANYIIRKISDPKDLSALVVFCSSSAEYFYAFVVSGTILWSVWQFSTWLIVQHTSIGFGLGYMAVLAGCLIGVSLHTLFWLILLSIRLKTLNYDLNSFTPANSEVISRLTNILNKIIYFTGVYFAILTLLVASGLLGSIINNAVALPFTILGWIIIVVQFLVHRSTINGIVERERWESLNKLQMQMNTIQATEDLSNKDVSERLLRLADLHERIRSNRAGGFDFKSLLSLFSQLMLPLLGLLLGNFDKVMALFK